MSIFKLQTKLRIPSLDWPTVYAFNNDDCVFIVSPDFESQKIYYYDFCLGNSYPMVSRTNNITSMAVSGDKQTIVMKGDRNGVLTVFNPNTRTFKYIEILNDFGDFSYFFNPNLVVNNDSSYVMYQNEQNLYLVNGASHKVRTMNIQHYDGGRMLFDNLNNFWYIAQWERSSYLNYFNSGSNTGGPKTDAMDFDIGAYGYATINSNGYGVRKCDKSWKNCSQGQWPAALHTIRSDGHNLYTLDENNNFVKWIN